MPREQSFRSFWYHDHCNRKFHIQRFKQAGGSWYIACAIAYPSLKEGEYDDYQIMLATGTSENVVIGALKGLEEVFEEREREYQRPLEALLLQARIDEYDVGNVS